MKMLPPSSRDPKNNLFFQHEDKVDPGPNSIISQLRGRKQDSALANEAETSNVGQYQFLREDVKIKKS